MRLISAGLGGELLPFFGRLGALQGLDLSWNPQLRGDVADLAGATELRRLNLGRCPLVVGEVAALAALVHLGEDYWNVGQGRTRTGNLWLGGTAVHGPVAALRALPGLGADWGSFVCTNGVCDSRQSCRNGVCEFTPCSAYGAEEEGGHWGTGSPGCGTRLPPVAVRLQHPALSLALFPRLSPARRSELTKRRWGRTRQTWPGSTRALAAPPLVQQRSHRRHQRHRRAAAASRSSPSSLRASPPPAAARARRARPAVSLRRAQRRALQCCCRCKRLAPIFSPRLAWRRPSRQRWPRAQSSARPRRSTRARQTAKRRTSTTRRRPPSAEVSHRAGAASPACKELSLGFAFVPQAGA